MAIEILGHRSDLPFNLTTEQAADFIKEKFPDIWKTFYTKRIDPPGNYLSFKAPAVTMAVSVIETSQGSLKAKAAVSNTAIAASIMQQYDYPTYYVSRNLAEALRHTKPLDSTWSELFFPFDGMIFMLPKGFLKEPDSGEPINFVGVAKFRSDKPIKIPFISGKIAVPPEDRIIIFWSTHSGLVIQDCTFPVSQKLEPSVGWINSKTQEYEKVMGEYKGPSGDFSSYVSGLVANFILVMNAKPELIEEGSRIPVKKKFLERLGVPTYSPNFIGRKYEILREKERPNTPTGAHFTELRWRAGYFGRRYTGEGRNKMKVVLVEAYIAFSAGLVNGAGG